MRSLGLIGSAARRCAMLVVLLAVLWPAAAVAQLQQEYRGQVGVGIELKAGPYLPALAEGASNGGLQTWDDIYGSDRDRVLINLGLEVQLFRSHYGTIAVGGTIGYVAWSSPVPREAVGTLEPGVAGETTFTMIPMTLTLGYRFDYLMQRTVVPVAPYVRGGLAYNVWFNDTAFEGQDGKSGGRLGLVGSVGLAFPLNVINRKGASNLESSFGIRTTYVFAEGQLSWIDGFGDGNLDLSELTWFAGLMVEI